MTDPSDAGTEAADPGSAPPIRSAVRLESGPNLLVRVLWFLFIGWWLSAIVNAVAWLLNATIIGLPAGLYLINRIPYLATLKSPRKELVLAVGDGGARPVGVVRPRQRPWWQRAIYFVLVGWWFSGLWMAMAWAATLTVVLMPLGFWMYGAVGKVTTLKR